MPYHINLGWKIVGSIANSATDYKRDQISLFNTCTGKGLLQDVGGNVVQSFFPVVLVPTPVFYNGIRPALQSGAISGKKFPLVAHIPSEFCAVVSRVSLNLAIHVYDGQVCLSVRYSGIDVPDEVDFSGLQDIARHPALLVLAKRVMSIVLAATPDASEYGGDLKAYPCLHIEATAGTPDLSRESLASIVTRHPEVNAAITQSVFDKNDIHQVDSSTLLLDRQGIISFVPATAADATKRANKRRVRSCFAMLELAAIASRCLRAFKGSSRRDMIDELTPLLGDSKDAIPDSTTAQRAWQLISNEFGLSRALAGAAKILSDTNPILTTSQGSLEIMSKSNRSDTLGALLMEPNKSVLCIAAAVTEFSAVRAYLKEQFGEEGIVRLNAGDEESLFEYKDPENGATWYLGGLAFQGETEAAAYAKSLQGRLKTSLVLMVGMCMGMPKHNVSVGTVIVPNEVFSFDHQRITSGGSQYRPHGREVVNGPHNIARLVSTDPDLKFKVRVDKGLASANSKVENVDSVLVDFIENSFPDAIAYDMEGWGFYRAGKSGRYLLIKAVADKGEHQNQDSDGQAAKQGIQSTVSVNAAAFAIRVARSYFSSRVVG